ncbi:MAG: 3-hydroxyacyl-CoA dehydrogenase NAD-binding domain-containing protein [Gammaproteobacteria bacterium]|nr:3-hydroxyacyl-CoA dehydrogenase NAD-binding domain-containing protein [Gammaproteobacteria bacterium]
MNHYKHWKVEIDHKKIAWLGLDRANSAVNTINHQILDELNSLLQDIEERADLIGVVIHSLKKKGFIAGADVHLFSKFETSEPVLEFLRKGQVVFARLESLTIPTIALIDGFCLGGGLELALACRYRIATDSIDTKLGLPEILLGFHPGWGGTVRLPRLIGGLNALGQMILLGKSVSGSRAKQLGIVDDVVPYRQLKRAAYAYMQQPPKPHAPSWMEAMTNRAGMRTLLAAFMRYKTSKFVNKNHYPAPFATIDLWEREGAVGERSYLQEIDSVEHLMTQNDTAKNLIRAFLLRDRMKGFAKNSSFKAQKVHVIGAGTMGGDIAAWCALCGLTVTIQDKSIEQIAPMMVRATLLYKKVLKKPYLVQAALDRLIPDVSGEGIRRADVVIEAVFENLNVKRAIFKRIEAEARPDALIATNTSSIPLEEIAEALTQPERLVGIHFFNPVSKMELVEVVHSSKTASTVYDAACAFVGQIRKLPLPVKSSPGFLINRVLMPYLMSAVALLEEGHKPEQVDLAAKAFGMMMGPVELADTVGLDVCLAVAENLISHFGGTVPQLLRDKVKKGNLGRKSGHGFYLYKKGKAVKKHIDASEKNDVLIDRLMGPLVKEANLCLKEKVVQDADLLDGGMIFATGFAPFRGGPIHWSTQGKHGCDETPQQRAHEESEEVSI